MYNTQYLGAHVLLVSADFAVVLDVESVQLVQPVRNRLLGQHQTKNFDIRK